MENHIPGIHNYCDRWCARCTFTSRCAVYENEANVPPEEQDISNKAFWERIGENFAKAQALIRRAAAEQGIDLDAIVEETKEGQQREDALMDEMRSHPLAAMSLEYSKMGRDWLKTQPGMLNRLETLKTELTLGVASEESARRETRTISESIAVVQWYLFFIHSKLCRALMGRVGNMAVEGEDIPHDYDGSAKIAIIAIERSINAWSALFDILPEHEDHFLKVLSWLEKIKNMTIEEFPGSATFVRPGFDE